MSKVPPWKRQFLGFTGSRPLLRLPWTSDEEEPQPVKFTELSQYYVSPVILKPKPKGAPIGGASWQSHDDGPSANRESETCPLCHGAHLEGKCPMMMYRRAGYDEGRPRFPPMYDNKGNRLDDSPPPSNSEDEFDQPTGKGKGHDKGKGSGKGNSKGEVQGKCNGKDKAKRRGKGRQREYSNPSCFLCNGNHWSYQCLNPLEPTFANLATISNNLPGRAADVHLASALDNAIRHRSSLAGRRTDLCHPALQQLRQNYEQARTLTKARLEAARSAELDKLRGAMEVAKKKRRKGRPPRDRPFEQQLLLHRQQAETSSAAVTERERQKYVQQQIAFNNQALKERQRGRCKAKVHAACLFTKSFAQKPSLDDWERLDENDQVRAAQVRTKSRLTPPAKKPRNAEYKQRKNEKRKRARLKPLTEGEKAALCLTEAAGAASQPSYVHLQLPWAQALIGISVCSVSWQVQKNIHVLIDEVTVSSVEVMQTATVAIRIAIFVIVGALTLFSVFHLFKYLATRLIQVSGSAATTVHTSSVADRPHTAQFLRDLLETCKAQKQELKDKQQIIATLTEENAALRVQLQQRRRGRPIPDYRSFNDRTPELSSMHGVSHS